MKKAPNKKRETAACGSACLRAAAPPSSLASFLSSFGGCAASFYCPLRASFSSCGRLRRPSSLLLLSRLFRAAAPPPISSLLSLYKAAARPPISILSLCIFCCIRKYAYLCSRKRPQQPPPRPRPRHPRRVQIDRVLADEQSARVLCCPPTNHTPQRVSARAPFHFAIQLFKRHFPFTPFLSIRNY